MRLLRTAMVPLAELALLDGNPNRGDVDAIAESLATHGQYRSIVVREATMEVLAGNHTLQAMRQLGSDSARCDVIECDDIEARQIALVDNRLSDLSHYDDDALTEMLASLEGRYEGTGYDQTDLDALLKRLSLPPAGDADEDEIDRAICAVVIDCSTEAEQRDLIDRLSAEGLVCRALI